MALTSNERIVDTRYSGIHTCIDPVDAPMNPISKSDAQLLQRFVEKFEELSDLLFCPNTDPIAKEFRTGESDGSRIREKWRPLKVATDPSALDGLHAKLPARIPKLFEHLLLNYRWAEVDLDMFTLTANPIGHDLSRWLAEASRDTFLWNFHLSNGYIPFAKGHDYDRICFETKTRKKGDECRIVKIDHEGVLVNERIVIVRELAPSFRLLVEQTIAHKKPSGH
jgi:hypothetical protein